MREILFRGKAIGGSWKTGSLLRDEEQQEFCGEWVEVWKIDGYEIDPATVGQFTGLLDKNGKKIFEGDIVKDTAGGIYKVVYDAEYMRFAFDDGIKWGLEGFESLNDFEVIGNAFDNPKLLEEQ